MEQAHHGILEPMLAFRHLSAGRPDAPLAPSKGSLRRTADSTGSSKLQPQHPGMPVIRAVARPSVRGEVSPNGLH